LIDLRELKTPDPFVVSDETLYAGNDTIGASGTGGSTLPGNTADSGGGIYTTSAVTLVQVVVQGNSATDSSDIFNSGAIVVGLVGGASGSTLGYVINDGTLLIQEGTTGSPVTATAVTETTTGADIVLNVGNSDGTIPGCLQIEPASGSNVGTQGFYNINTGSTLKLINSGIMAVGDVIDDGSDTDSGTDADTYHDELDLYAIFNAGVINTTGGSSGTPLLIENAFPTLDNGYDVDLYGTGSLVVGDGSSAYVQLGKNYRTTSTVGALTINTGSTLDITDNNLAIHYTTDPKSTIVSYLASAYYSALWTGEGLTSSTVAAQVDYAIAHGGGVWSIGYDDGNTDIHGPAVSNQLVILPALAGDANLNQDVSFPDLGIIAQNLGSAGDWTHGNFNYDGTVSFLDIGIWSQNQNYTSINTPLE